VSHQGLAEARKHDVEVAPGKLLRGDPDRNQIPLVLAASKELLAEGDHLLDLVARILLGDVEVLIAGEQLAEGELAKPGAKRVVGRGKRKVQHGPP
jgi:hypothetical protein